MLTFEEKLAVIQSFPQLKRKDVSLGRVNFHYDESVMDKKIVVYHLHPNGNGFVYAGNQHQYSTDKKGLVNIRDFSEEELRLLIQKSIDFLSPKKETNIVESAIIADAVEEERWSGPENQELLLVHEDELWNVYSGLNLEEAFESYKEAERYLLEEGFRRKA